MVSAGRWMHRLVFSLFRPTYRGTEDPREIDMNGTQIFAFLVLPALVVILSYGAKSFFEHRIGS